MNLTYFKSYLEVVKRGSFSEAAKVLGVSQPTVSLQIQRLEEDVGATLLERRGGRVMVTAAGKEFQAFAQRVLDEQVILRERLAALQGEVAGTLMLGASTHPGEHLLPAIMGAFRRRYPHASASITIADTARIIEGVLAQACDAGFVGADMRRRRLVTKRIAEDRLLLIAAPGHPLTTRPPVHLQDLVRESFVMREEGSGTQRTVEELMVGAGLAPHRLTVALRVGSSQAVVTAVEAGVGIAFVPQTAAARSLELGRVRSIPIEGLDWVRGIYFVYLKNPARTRLFEEFVRFVDEWSAGQKDDSKRAVL